MGVENCPVDEPAWALDIDLQYMGSVAALALASRRTAIWPAFTTRRRSGVILGNHYAKWIRLASRRSFDLSSAPRFLLFPKAIQRISPGEGFNKSAS
jgi:hypothetical protein